MRISVAIPTWNRAALVREAVLAALRQTRRPDEIVVSDDASPDDTVQVLESLAREHPTVRVLRQPVNLKGVANWSAALNASTGDLIALCSDDDQFEPGHLEAAERHFAANPEVALVHGWFRTLETQPDGTVELIEHPLGRRNRSLRGAEVLPYLVRFYSWPFHPSTLVMRRSLWESVGPFDPRYRLADTDWFLRAALRGRIDFLPESHVLNRRHVGNWSNSMGAVAMHQEVDEIARRFLDQLRAEGTPRAELLALREVWRANELYRTLRLTVARGRAGAREQCIGSLRLLADALPGGALLPDSVVRVAGGALTFGLSNLQRFLPGGRAKYASLGVSVPK